MILYVRSWNVICRFINNNKDSFIIECKDIKEYQRFMRNLQKRVNIECCRTTPSTIIGVKRPSLLTSFVFREQVPVSRSIS